jgi:hypothetical protein
MVPEGTLFHVVSAVPATPRITIVPPLPTYSALGMSVSALLSCGVTATACVAGADTWSA